MPEKPAASRQFVKSGAVWGLAIFALALVIRLIGIGWGLPNEIRNQSLHPDEPVIWTYSQQIEPAKGDFDPGFYNYGTFYLTVLRVATDVVRAYAGSAPNPTPTQYWQEMGRYHLAGRVVSALAGAFMAWTVFAILRRRTSLLGAIAGGVACSLAPGLVIHSRFQTVDVLAACFLALSLFYSLRLIPGGEEDPDMSLKWAALAGLFAGLSAGTKYTGFLALLTLFVAILAQPKGQRLKLAAIGIGIALSAFFLTTPGALTNTSKFIDDTRYEIQHTATGHGLVFVGTSPGFLYHFGNLSAGMGVILFLTGGAGLTGGLIRRKMWIVALVAFALVYYVLIGRAEVKFFRYVIPLIPVLSVGFGWLIGQAQRNPDLRWRWLVVLGIIGVGGALSQTAINTYWMASQDPRDQAAVAFKTKTPESSVGVVSDPWFQTPPFYPDTALPRWVPPEQRDAARRASTNPRVVQHMPPDFKPYDWDIRLLEEDKPDYVVYSSFEFNDVARIADLPNLDPGSRLIADRARGFMKKLREDYELQPSYGTDAPIIHDLMYIRPTIWIWKRKTQP